MQRPFSPLWPDKKRRCGEGVKSDEENVKNCFFYGTQYLFIYFPIPDCYVIPILFLNSVFKRDFNP